MNSYYFIEYYQKSTKHWVRHNFIDYISIEEAKKEINLYEEHKLGIKFRILHVKVIAL